MLSQVTDTEFWVTDDFTGVEFIVTEDAFQEGRLARTVAADEADFGITTQGTLGSIEKDLVPVAFMRVSDLQQDGH
jgi:hypothetical protein